MVEDKLRELESLGARIYERSTKLVVEAPRGLITDDHREWIRENRDEILCSLADGGDEVPWLDERGTLHIPLDANPKYRWWQCGQSIGATLRELNAPPSVLAKYDVLARPGES